jgi:hypothetical protein
MITEKRLANSCGSLKVAALSLTLCPPLVEQYGTKISITEQVSNFNYLGCDVTYKYDEDLNDKLCEFQNICGVIVRTTKKKTRK